MNDAPSLHLNILDLCARFDLSVGEVHPATRGFTPAIRARLRLRDGRWVFLKAAADDETAGWLEREIATYRALEGAPFLPRLLDVLEDTKLPAMLLEDLGEAHWPPAWRPGDVEAVLGCLERIAGWPVPPHLGSMASSEDDLLDFRGWSVIAEDPAAFLGLGLCSAAWLARSLPSLLAWQDRANLEGGELMHADVRGDNLCIDAGGRVRFVDWNWACRGAGRFDVAFWLPSLAMEGGPKPWEVLNGSGAMAAVVSGFFCSQAGLPPLPKAPGVRPFQRAQGKVALEWAARELSLGPGKDP